MRRRVSAVPSPVQSAGLFTRVHALRDEHAARWDDTPAPLPALGPRLGAWRRLSNAWSAERLVDAVAAEVAALPEEPAEQRAWRERLRERLRDFGRARLGWPQGYERLLFGDAFFEASVSFVREARAAAPRLHLEDLWQAMRNVWIANSLQMILERPLGLGAGVFGYSMLYPLTDNLLDDPGVAPRRKREFVERFGRRLSGRATQPRCEDEALAFRMVERIEDEFPRRAFPQVHESLLAIHAAQVASLRQQRSVELGDRELLLLSCEKGGTSVLADLYLVGGTPSGVEERLAFGYGVFLQLLDDLQDVASDLAAGHQTLFTRQTRRGPLDALAGRLVGFMGRILDDSPLLATPGAADRKDLIRRNCTSLLVGAIAEQPRFFSFGFRRRVTAEWPLSLRAQRRLRRRAVRRFGNARRVLEERRGAPMTIESLLGLVDARKAAKGSL
jgi:hypothetical protein